MTEKSRQIYEAIKRMRRYGGVEPEVIYIRRDVYASLDKPRKISGIPVVVDDKMPLDFEVR